MNRMGTGRGVGMTGSGMRGCWWRWAGSRFSQGDGTCPGRRWRWRFRGGRGRGKEEVPGRQAVAGEPLPGLEEGALCRIVELDTLDPLRLQRLLALGLVPGTRVKLMQRFPCYVVSLGTAQVALDAHTAAAVRVAREPALSEAPPETETPSRNSESDRPGHSPAEPEPGRPGDEGST